MNKLITCCLILCCCCSTAYATNKDKCKDKCKSQGKDVAHICSNADLDRGKVNVCHVPPGCPKNEHTICVSQNAVDNDGVGHFPGQHGGDYFGVCESDQGNPTPTPTATPTATPSCTPTPRPSASPTPNPSVSPTPEGSPTPQPSSTPTPEPSASPTPQPSSTPTPQPSASPTPSEKVKICHLTGESDPRAINIEVALEALPAHIQHGDHQGACVFDCAGAPFGEATVDACGICGGDGSACKGCDGTANSGKKLDDCGVCGGQNNTCLDCAGVPNGGKKTDSCGMCGGDGTSCVDCSGIPNGPNKPDSCGVCSGSNSCLDCSGIPNGGTLVDKCGTCGGSGGEVTKIRIDKKKLIKLAHTLLLKKTIPYFNGAVKCNKAFTKLAGKGTTSAKATHKAIVEAITKLKTEVLLCPGECERDINKELLKLINSLAKTQYKYAAQAQHAGRNACKNDGPGLALTKPIENNIHTIVNNCPTHVCK